MIPKKPAAGDEIRVIAPARSLSLINEYVRQVAAIALEEMGFKVTFGRHVLENDEFMSSSIYSRIEDLHGKILFIEDDELSSPETFDRDLQSIVHLPGFNGVRGIVIGRFQKNSEMTMEKLHKIIGTKGALKRLPIVANVNFGHTTPHITFPIGGNVELIVESKEVSIVFNNH